MKDNLLLLLGALLFFTHSCNQVRATSLETSPVAETQRSLRFVPSGNTGLLQATGIIIELGRDQAFETNLNILRNVTFDMDLAEHPDIEAELRKLQAYAPLISCLDVSDNSLDNSTLELLSSFTVLKKLTLANNRFDDDGLKAIGLLSRISELNLYHNKITAKGIPLLVALKELTMLDVSCTVMKASGIKAIQETFPQLISLQARGCQLDDQSLEYILAMPNLRKVDISSNKSLSENAVQAFIAKACGHGLAVIASS